MNPIDLRDVLSRLFSQPTVLLPELWRVVGHHLAANWWVIAIGTVVFVVARAVLRRRRRTHTTIARTETRRAERNHAKRSLMSAVGQWVLWVAYILFLLGQVGITLSSMTTGILLGSLGVAGALVAQNFLRDLLAGYYIVSEDQYGIGDYADFGFGFAGVVTSIGLRTTTLRAPDGTTYHVRHSEFSRVGNRTQASGALLLDIGLTPHDEHPPSPAEVDEWSAAIVSATIDLRRTLLGVREVSTDQGLSSASLSDVADVVPTLVPNLTEQTLVDMAAITDDAEPDADVVQRALSKAPAGITPMFSGIEMLGLVDAATDSVTVRLRVRLREQSSRSYAMQLLRRRIFDEMSTHGVAPSFSDVPEGEVIN